MSAGILSWPKRLMVCLLMMALAACGAGQDELPCESDPACLRYGIAADLPFLDPHLARSHAAGSVFRQIFDTLVYRHPITHEYLPGLAEAWHISDDGLHYTFMLRQGIRFHDDAPFDAAAVSANLERILDPQLPADHARSLLGPLTRVEALNASAIRLSLSAPFAPLLDGLAQPFLSMASPLALSEYSHLRHQFHLAGTGPFRMQEYLPGDRVSLRRYESYAVDPPVYAPRDGSEIARIEFHIASSDPGDALPGFDQSLDVLDNLPPLAARNLAGNSRVQLLPVDIPGSSTQFLFNTRRAPINRREVRLALLLATDRRAIVDQVYLNFSLPAWAPLSLSSGYAHAGYADLFGYDPVAARELLAAAGYADGDGDGILEGAGGRLSMSIAVPPWSGLPAVAALLQRQWRALGIELLIETVPGAARLSGLIESGQVDLLPVEHYGIDPHLLSRVFGVDGEYAASRAPDPQLDELLQAAMREMDSQARRSLVYAIQARIMDEALVLPIRDSRRLTAARPEILNLRFDAYGLYPLLSNVKRAHAEPSIQR